MFTSEDPSTKAAVASRNGATAPGDLPNGIREERRRAPVSRSAIDPLYIARAVWNAKLPILATTVLGLGAAVLVARVTPKMYVATTQILMDPRDIKVVANEVTPNGLPSEATLALVESQTSVINSSNVLSRVIDEARLEDDPEFNGEAKRGLVTLLPPALSRLLEQPDAAEADRRYQTLARLREALTVGRETKSFVINLSIDSSDPEKAARLANLTADVFIEEQGRVQSETARRATMALSSRLSELRQSVVNAERAVEDYKSRNALIGVGGRLVDDEYITRINDQLAKARGDITALRVKADSMRTASVEDVVRGTLPEELSSEALVRLRQTYSDLAQQAAVLATKLGPRHPQRIASEGALTASRHAIAGELSRIVAAAQTELARAVETEKNLTSQIGALKDKQVETSGSFVKLRELEREVDASRAVYEAFLLRARETSEQESFNTANVRVISEATPPLQPFGLSRKTMIAAGGIVGFLVGVGIAAFFAIVRLLRAVFAGERRRNPERRWPETGPGRDVPPAPAGGVYHSPPPLPVSVSEMRPSVFASGDAVRRLADVLALSEAEAARDARPEARSEASTAGHAPVHGRQATSEMPDTDGPQPARGPAAPDAPADLRSVRGEAGARAADAVTRAAGAGPGISLADAGRGASLTPPGERLPPDERRSLRDRVRALSAEAEAAASGRASVDAEAAAIRDEIQTVRQALMDIRRRRQSAGR